MSAKCQRSDLECSQVHTAASCVGCSTAIQQIVILRDVGIVVAAPLLYHDVVSQRHVQIGEESIERNWIGC